MDLDAFVAVHEHEWARLEQLVSRRGTLTGADGDELLELYQRVATHLSQVRSTTPDPALVAHLSALLARARSRSLGTRTLAWSDLRTFFAVTFPAALYGARRWWLTTTAVSLAVAFALGWWFVANPQLESALASPREIEALVGHEFEDYYSQYAAGSFALRVWTNNAWVAALCLAFGVFGLPVVLLLWTNLLNLAVVGALMWRYERAPLFFGLILPHGLLELTAVFVAAGVGLRIFWAWVEPGSSTRLAGVAGRARAAMSVALGLVAVLLISGLIEAFVTPSGLPTAARILVGVLAEAAFFAYVFVVGRAAARSGATGDVAARDRAAAAPTVG